MANKRKGFELIIETQNNNNFEYIKRNNPDLIVEHDGWIVKLCYENSEIVEKLIKQNDNYSISFAELVFKGIVLENGEEFLKTDKKSIEAMIRIIDDDNSTQVWQHGKERIFRMAEYIGNPKNNFWNRLKARDITLVEELITSAKNTSGDGDNLISLSSKICKYLSQFMYNNFDGYFISDRFVKRALPFYCAHYNIEIEGLDLKKPTCNFFNDYKYEALHKALLQLQKEINTGVEKDKVLTKHQIDHIMWFCYRSRTEVEDERNPI